MGNKKNIGIITQHLAGNYGGILQNFALQQVLKANGYAPITLFLNVAYPFYRYILSSILSVLYRIVGTQRPFPPKPYNGRSLYPSTAHFIIKRIKMIKAGFSKYNMELLDKYKINALIVGSDQVWRLEYNTNIEDMFLAFARDFKGKKISYAASFGVDNWEYPDIQTRNCRELIRAFDAVSVREESGVELCSKFLHRDDVVCVLDPTLLLSKNDYLSLCKNNKTIKGNNIFAYILDDNSQKEEILSIISKDKSMGITKCRAYNEEGPSVEQWLANIRDASIVVTDSFHGTVFSILLEKDFYVILNEERGSSRIISLLEKLGLESRIVRCSDDINRIEYFVDWKLVNRRLQILREDSLSFLQKNLL